ncbi:hypothetical protein [Neobacillus citreus]|uniref:DUF1643 domain-containing protein n=1 Tax=Neobacillus citreus TaxID=2833578 RepID=A0A942YDT6_9BACI|nr:hypothetical protein [Neobacillus citreus]MCH6265111.1 hypothetical protein [Neobacillus citreus]
MSKPKAYGTFVKRGDNIYRTSAYIQWGNSEKSIGACLLLNPGSATLDKDLIYSLDTVGSASGWIKTEDPTMEQLISFIEKTHEKNQLISGRLHIYNLFNLQNTKSENAIDQFEELVSSGEYDINESLVALDELVLHPWILLGWGVKQEIRWKNLQHIKGRWRERIVESKIPTFGKKHAKKNEYYHPCPLIPTQRPLILNELVELYKQRVFAQRKEHELLKRYTLLKWNGEYGIETKFIVKDNLTNMQSLLIPGKLESMYWFEANLANDVAVTNWEDFGDTSLDDLEDVMM